MIIDACAFYRCQDGQVTCKLRRFRQPDEVVSADQDSDHKSSDKASDDDYNEDDKYFDEDEDEDNESSDGGNSSSGTGDSRSSWAGRRSWRKERNRKIASSEGAAKFQRDEDFLPLTDEQCLLANPLVPGMDLKTKEWSESSRRNPIRLR